MYYIKIFISEINFFGQDNESLQNQVKILENEKQALANNYKELDQIFKKAVIIKVLLVIKETRKKKEIKKKAKKE